MAERTDDPHAQGRQRLEASVLEGAGATEPSLREACARREGLPSALESYVDKVHREAYRITDDDVAALKQAGYSDDQLFEITLSAALGAARQRLETALRAMEAADASGQG